MVAPQDKEEEVEVTGINIRATREEEQTTPPTFTFSSYSSTSSDNKRRLAAVGTLWGYPRRISSRRIRRRGSPFTTLCYFSSVSFAEGTCSPRTECLSVVTVNYASRR